MPKRRSARRAALLPPAVALTWALIVGLPLAPRAGTPGHLASTRIVLTGADAASVAPATGDGTKARRTTGPAGKGWSASVPLDHGTQMVAFTWDGRARARAGTLQVRSRLGSTWSGWEALEADPDEGPDTGGNGRAGVGPVWLGSKGADQVEVKIDGAPLADLSMLKMKWTDPTAGSGDQAHAEATGPDIRPRTDWAPGGWVGTNPDCTKKPIVMDQLKFAVVHHTVNSNDYTQSQVPGILAGIYRYHTGEQAWCDIAYNFLIDRFGTVWQGRSGDINVPVMGGHAKGFNTDSVGIALLGQYEPGAPPAAAKPSAAEVNALEQLLAWKLSIHAIDPTAKVTVTSHGSTSIPEGKKVTIPTIIGHRQVGSTDCPGQSVYDLLPAIRTDVEALIDKARTPAVWAPFATPRGIARQQYTDLLGRDATDTEQAGWASAMQRDDTDAPTLITNILTSTEFADERGSVVRLYLAYFGRLPDHGGLHHWWDALRAGDSKLDDVSSAFAGSTEFERQYGQLDTEAFVRQVYRNVLGRDPEATGLAYWSNQIDEAGKRRGAVMTGFSESNENRRITADKVDIISVYEGMFDRAPVATNYVQWVAKLAGGTPLVDFVTQAYEGTEYTNRIKALG